MDLNKQNLFIADNFDGIQHYLSMRGEILINIIKLRRETALTCNVN